MTFTNSTIDKVGPFYLQIDFGGEFYQLLSLSIDKNIPSSIWTFVLATSSKTPTSGDGVNCGRHRLPLASVQRHHPPRGHLGGAHGPCQMAAR